MCVLWQLIKCLSLIYRSPGRLHLIHLTPSVPQRKTRLFTHLNRLFVELTVGNALSLYISLLWYLSKDLTALVYGGNTGVTGAYSCIYYINVTPCFEIECESVCVCVFVCKFSRQRLIRPLGIGIYWFNQHISLHVETGTY